ncbi:MAG TPA: DUF1801 domain-containing protein [Mucilaginibacter sp.]|jgi:hypothetical protein|nr:DUF1801 domain-containing protein [Mucilaginibacter sp.]
MHPQIAQFYLEKDEPLKSCLLNLHDHILHFDKDITEAWKFNMPFFCYKGNRFCYFRMDQKKGIPYLGFNDGKWVEHPALTFEQRSRIKILLIDPDIDLPLETIDSILKMAIKLYD